MRKIFTAAGVALTSMCFVGSASAQAGPPGVAPPSARAATDGEEKKMGIGGDLLFLFPLGDLGDVTGPQIGPLVRFGYRVIPALEVTGRVGYLFGLKKSIGNVLGTDISVGLNIIPIWAGARYFIMEPTHGLYGAAELGLNLLSASASGASSSSNTTTRLGANLGVGYVISKELPIDIRAQFTTYNLLLTESGEKTYFGLGISGGYTYQF